MKKTERDDRIEIVIRESLELSAEEQHALQQIMWGVADSALRQHSPSPRSLHIVLSDDDELQTLNAGWRGLDRPTDVLSFAADEGETLSSVARVAFLGDVILSLSRAREQAAEYGHSLAREVGFLTAHGVLHLLGFDHMMPEQEQDMLAAQRGVMDDVKLFRDDGEG